MFEGASHGAIPTCPQATSGLAGFVVGGVYGAGMSECRAGSTGAVSGLPGLSKVGVSVLVCVSFQGSAGLSTRGIWADRICHRWGLQCS